MAVAAVMVPASAAGAGLLPEPLAAISAAVEEAIRAGETPGAVVLIGHQGHVVLRQAFGHRRLAPPRPMTPDAVFDVASLTKVLATTPAVLQLMENGRLELDAAVARYWPEFKGHGKERITVRQLLTHYSGLRPGLLPKPAWSGYNAALKKIADDTVPFSPDSRFVYSDLNFTILGELVRRVSGESLEVYCRRHIFEPLGMKDTGFKPSTSLNGRLAPTMEGSFGVVHDPDTRRMGWHLRCGRAFLHGRRPGVFRPDHPGPGPPCGRAAHRSLRNQGHGAAPIARRQAAGQGPGLGHPFSFRQLE